MSLTSAQKATLKAYILAQPDLAPMFSGETTDLHGLVLALNSDATPACKSWKTQVQPETMDLAADYTVFDGLTAGKRDSWGYLVRTVRDFSNAKVRKWVTDIWGNATANSSSEAILNAGTELCSRAEVMFGVSSVTVGTVTAMVRTWAGDITLDDIVEIHQS